MLGYGIFVLFSSVFVCANTCFVFSFEFNIVSDVNKVALKRIKKISFFPSLSQKFATYFKYVYYILNIEMSDWIEY